MAEPEQGAVTAQQNQISIRTAGNDNTLRFLFQQIFSQQPFLKLPGPPWMLPEDYAKSGFG